MTDNRKLIVSWLGKMSSAIPCLVLSYQMSRLWIAPQSMEESWYGFGGGLLVMEFFAIHATGITAGITSHFAERKTRRASLLVAAVAAYLAVGWGFSLLFGSQDLFVYFAALIIGRSLAGLSASQEESKETPGCLWFSAVLYIAVGIPSFNGGWPRLGITPEVADRAAQSMPASLSAQLHGLVGGAAIYFAIVGLYGPVSVAVALRKLLKERRASRDRA